jgi:uncharacterized protein YfaS (alpha-2-macroglobulin family)
MVRFGRISILGAALVAALGLYWLTAAEKAGGNGAPDGPRADAMKLVRDGNWKDGYDALRKIALDPKADPIAVSTDLNTGIQCLANLGRVDEIDEFRESIVAVHKKNWRLLQTAAQSFANVQHQGFIVAGKFYRGHHRGGDGRFVSTWQRDRVRALQLMQQAMEQTADEKDKPALASFYLDFANMLLNGGGVHAPWRLQYLADLSKLPDYEEGYYWPGQDQRGAPVDADGNPIYHHIPKSWETAKTDGERWRWMLVQAAEYDSKRASEIDMMLARFCHSQFGVETMAWGGFHFPQDDRKEGEKTGTFALHTLSDDETIARLAAGVKRFKLPDEFNWIKIYQRVAGRGKSPWGEQSRDAIASEYENRRQYVKAADAWKTALAEYGVGVNNSRKQRLDQIVSNWGRFEPGETQPAGKGAVVDFRFRNGNKVSFEAFAVNVPKLLDDVKAYLKSSPPQLDWQKMNISEIGYRLVEQQEKQYIGEKVASWDLDLKPRPAHVDDRVTVTTPLQKPGAYLLTGKMADGNLSRIIVWVSDTVIVKKNLEGKAMYYVADAVNGQPLAKADLEFFGWHQFQVKPNQNLFQVATTAFNETTDADGQVRVDGTKMGQENQWLITARTPGKEGRFAYLGFTGAWFGQLHDPEYNATKVFGITDRPVYRPAQTVQWKFWIAHAKYDQGDNSEFANRAFTVQVHNPKGDKILDKPFTTDEYGGISGELPLPAGTTLGTYQIMVVGHGGTHFRVEEYKKPEFEVKIDAPKEPVRLGESVTATIQSKYYFGAPVTNAKVKYTVMRTSYDSHWYPNGAWDWFYGAGYWWFSPDYAWYPGWRHWGCERPMPVWWWGRGHEQPEIVLQNEVQIGADGIVKVEIDTKLAKEVHGDQDHQYTITAEVVDESRRTIVGTGNVLVSREPFKVFSWVDRGHYRAGDTIKASFSAHTLDHKPVEGKGELTLFRISYDEKNKPVEKAVESWKLDTNVEGNAQQQMKAGEAGQYRLAYKVTDSKGHTIEGGYLFVVRGEGFNGKDYRFNDLELITDKREYAPGDKVKLLINTNKSGGTVLLFVRPTNGVYLAPKVIRLQGKSTEEEIAVVQRDMPNFFIEALSVADGKVHTETREVVVPPEKRVLNVEVLPSQTEYKPGAKATVKVKLTDAAGKPYVGSTVLTFYDKSVEYISGGSNVPEIREFFWKWRRHHQPQSEISNARWFQNLLRNGEIGMSNLGVFGALAVEEFQAEGADLDNMKKDGVGGGKGFGGRDGMANAAAPAAAPAPGGFGREEKAKEQDAAGPIGAQPPAPPVGPEPTVRQNFADTALWKASLTTNQEGIAEVSLTMPENLTGWKVKVWAMGHGTRVGQGEAEVVTKKDLLLRLQAPRFFVQTDEVVLSANVHNYLKAEKNAAVTLEVEGGTLELMGPATQQVKIAASGERRVDWRVKVTNEGQAIVRMKAITDEESDAMQMSFPCLIHGMLKMDSFSGVVRPEKDSSQVALVVPPQRRIEESRLEVRYSPSLAGAMVDALPYLVDYPYGCTEQTLNRFVPTVITQHILLKMDLDLKDIEKKRTNLNAQEIGDDQQRAKGWKRFDRNPVFNVDEVKKMSRAGVDALAAMQCSDGGWGWFSGFGEHSYPHTTAVVVHGLQKARENDVALPQGMLERGIEWLKRYQAEQVQLIRNAPGQIKPWKDKADNVDALVYMVLADANLADEPMRDFLYRDRTDLAVYAKAMFGLALHKQGQNEKLTMILKNIEQYLVQDDENQTAYLKLPESNYWWAWYGSENEANAFYLKLLAKTSPKDEKASRLVKYLLNNRKHATYWASTRDTAYCIEAMAEYLTASGEDKPNMTVEIWMDGKKRKEAKIDAKNLFTFDNTFVLTGKEVETGRHTLEVRRTGGGPVYYNAYLTNFTLEDFISKAGLEVKVNRKYYKLTRVDKIEKVPGARGQALDQKVEKYERTELPNLSLLKSGDLVEVELEIDSKNDYEYILFEDPKAAGFEAVLVRSGYNPNDLNAYMELRDDRVCFFVRALARGKHSVSYRLRAEIPGKFSALPARAAAMYAPELKGNSDEIKLGIQD